MSHSRTHFRFIACRACNHQFEWLGTRLPNHCPECGKPIIETLRGFPEFILVSDPDARVKYDTRRNVDNKDRKPIERHHRVTAQSAERMLGGARVVRTKQDRVLGE